MPSSPATALGPLTRSQRITIVVAVALTAAAAVVEGAGGGEVLRFVVAGLALAALAGVVGQAVEEVGERLGPSATGLLQSTLGNLPERFVGTDRACRSPASDESRIGVGAG